MNAAPKLTLLSRLRRRQKIHPKMLLDKPRLRQAVSLEPSAQQDKLRLARLLVDLALLI